MATKAKAKTPKPQEGCECCLFGVKFMGKFIEFIKGIFTADLLEFSIKWLTIIGHIGLVVAAAVGFLFFLVAAIKGNQLILLLYALVWIIVVFVVQYTAYRFISAGATLIKNNPTRLASTAFLDCVGFLSLLAGIVALVFNIYRAIEFKSLAPFLIGLGLFVFFEFCAIVALNPKTVSMEIVGEATAGQEAIGIITFSIKAWQKLVPIIFGVGIVVFTVIMFIDAIGLFSNEKFVYAYQSAYKAGVMIIIFALLPFVSYIIFVLYFLAIDIIRAILSIPGKLGK